MAGVAQGTETRFQVSNALYVRAGALLLLWHHTHESPESPMEGNVKQQPLPFTDTDMHEDNQCSYTSERDEKDAHSPFH